MIEASAAWKTTQQRLLLPEAFVEIDCVITEVGLQEASTASGSVEAEFSEVDRIRGFLEAIETPKYATLEQNLWALDGTRTILPDNAPYQNTGYVSNIAQSGSITLSLPEVHTALIPGVTITWCSEFGEYPPVFTVTAYNGDSVVAETTITDNSSAQSLVDLEISNYDRVTVTVHNWCLPDHRARIESVFLGHKLVFPKYDILRFTHEQAGSLVSGELPKNSIEFSIDNTDNRWNPHNPSGIERYLSERQSLTVRYGLLIDGVVEWIKAGTFYLSEWRAPSNGLEASFVARDLLEFMLTPIYSGVMEGTLYDIATAAVAQAALPDGASVLIDPVLKDYTTSFEGKYTLAEMLQMCANASCCVMFQDRDGVLRIEPRRSALSDYVISTMLSYSYPEIELSKKLKEVSVSYGDEAPYILPSSDEGETQTINNPLIKDIVHAANVASWSEANLKVRKTINGEFRADPRLDVFDVVEVESKYGNMAVVISDIKYTFNGSFQATYIGKVGV